jgi:hypothetical protein
MQWPPTSPGLEIQNISLRARRLQHIQGVDLQPLKDQGQLIH